MYSSHAPSLAANQPTRQRQVTCHSVGQVPRSIEDPILAYTAADGEINGIQWGATQPEWISICYSRVLEILRV